MTHTDNRTGVWRPFCPFSSLDPSGTQCPGLQQLGLLTRFLNQG